MQQLRFSTENNPNRATYERANHKTKNSFNAQQIIGIDGEGYNDKDGDHHYDLICASGTNWNKYIWAKPNTDELTAEQIFEFLLSLADEHGKALYFIYGGSYDFNMWVKRLPDNVLKRVNKRGKARYGHYTIQYRPRREIIIGDRRTIRFRRTGNGKCIHSYARRIHIYDVIGFFQMPFVKALADWNVTDNDTINLIQSMKLKRGEFDKVDKQLILKYCLEECRLLVLLGERLRDAAIRAGIKPRAWYGAGALATTLLMKNGVKTYIKSVDTDIDRYIKHSYFGGRTDIAYVGFFGKGFHYDISSAYPTAMVNHPCLFCGAWTQTLDGKKYQNKSGKCKYSIWHVKWNCHGVLWGPFPFRLTSGSITYPCCGEGYYHKVEIDAAMALYPEHEFTITDGVIYTTKCKHEPFVFIPESAKYRLELKAKKDAANKPLKLGLNSIYGKTAQTLGGRHGKRPPYQAFYWAGFTTAITRAKMLKAIQEVQGDIYSIATDGLISSGPIPVDIGPNLGQWECTEITNGILVKPGIYKWRDIDGKYHYGTRGFTKDEANWDDIEERWKVHRFAGYWKYPATRFIGLRQALHRGANWREYFGKWVDQTRKLTFFPEMNRRTVTVPITGKFGIPDFASPAIPEFCRLETICQSNSGVSAVYRKINPEEKDELMADMIDEEQP